MDSLGHDIIMNMVIGSTVETPEQIRSSLAQRYDLVDHHIDLDGRLFTLLGVRDTNALVDAINPEEFAVDERLPYWAELWTSSFALAQHCLRHDALTGKKVLELGTGLGLAGIAAACRGANVLLTDYDADALLFAYYNAWRHVPDGIRTGSVRTTYLDWRSPSEIGPFDLVLGADIVYERGSFQALLRLLDTCLSPGGCAVFADPDRTIGWDFFSYAAQGGFAIDCSPAATLREGRSSPVTIATLRPRTER